MIRKLMVILLSGTICLLAGSAALAVKYNEAPMLKALVDAGKLPPVEERLPKEPLVVEPVEEIGEYGGTLRSAPVGHHALEEYEFTFERPFMPTEEGGIGPSYAKGYKFSEDKKTLTVYLREGLKWSDGVPLTADDLMFWYEDQLQNKKLNPVIPKVWCPGGELMELKKIDEYTVQFHFAVSYPLIIKYLSHTYGTLEPTWGPAHYLKRFHIKYNPKADELAKKEGFDHWWQLYSQKRYYFDIDAPTHRAWIQKKKGPNYTVWERNPYYWKVDPAGNQLPYIDRLLFIDSSTKETYNAKIVAGEVDFAGFDVELKNLPLYRENAEKGDYRVLLWRSVHGADACYQLNQTYKKDLVLRDIFRDVRFRRALSLAIDREDINEVLYFGLAVPRQSTVPPQSKYYEPEFARAYAQHNPKEANRLLDEMGLKWDKNDEWRLRPDGKRLTILLETGWALITPKVAISELVKEYWKKIGIDLRIKVLGWEMMDLRYPSNEVQMGCWHTEGVLNFDLEPWYYIPTFYGWQNTWAPLWAQWYVTNGEKGEEPPEEIKKNLERFKKMQITVDEEERIRLGKEILRSQAENLWTIGTVGSSPQPIIVRNNLRNVPEEALLSEDYLWTMPQKPCQYFLKHPLLPSQK